MSRFFILLLVSSNYLQSLAQTSLQRSLDSIVLNAIDSMAFPGAQLYISIGTTVVHHKSYGHHTYAQNRKVKDHHVYDLASITKVSTGLPLLMKMVDRDLFDLDAPASQYINSWTKSNKEHLSFRQILAHESGLKPYIVFWQHTLNENGKFKRKTFQTKDSKRYPIRIHDRLYLHRKYRNKMTKAIKESDLGKPDYRYSGLSFLLMPGMIEEIINADFEQQLYTNIYHPLGLKRLRYRPLDHFPLEEIVPTEIDTVFRKQLVHGYVHDEAAAMLNGISCNAGLFGNAESLATLFHMYVQGGQWQGKQLIQQKTLREFTSYQYPSHGNRRGLGFDKPLLEYSPDKSYVAKSASSESFGHSGFTGTFVWADPMHEMVFVLLTNRVHPYRSQRKLYEMGVRAKLQELVYEWLKATTD